jgi:hypothetical protein
MEGRGSATAGGERAARYIEDALTGLGLRPAGDDGTFRQSFVIDAVPRAAAGALLERVAPGPMRFAAGSQWQPHGGSPAVEVSGEVVRVGHGVSADGHDGAGPDRARDGRFAAGPGGRDVAAGEADRGAPARAVALLIAADALPAPDATATPFDLPSASIARDAAAALGPGATVRLRAELARAGERRRCAPARDRSHAASEASARRALTTSGARATGSPPAPTTTPPAPRSCSAWRALSASGGLPRTVLFALFSGQELGSQASRHRRAPRGPMARTAAMLGADMVGRLGGAKPGSAAWLAAPACARPSRGGGAMPEPRSSSTSRTRRTDRRTTRASTPRACPCCSSTPAPHEDYHEPSDTADKIDAAGMARIPGSRSARGAPGSRPRPAFVQLAPPAPRGRPAAGAGRAFLGVTASGSGGDGVRLGGVLPGTAAERAGLRGGDVLVRVSDAAVESFADLRRAIGERRPGDLVRLVYLRDGRDHTAETTLGVQP